MNKKTPAYQQIKQYILGHIHRGEWRAGEMIPAEMRLAELFSVSRMTVNRALKELSEEKVLERRQGSGTFVAQQQFNHTFVEVRNIADDIRQAGKAYRAEVLNQMHCTFDTLPKALQVLFVESQSLLQIDIVHYADNKPLQYERRWVDVGLLPDFVNQDFSRINTSDYLITQVPLVKGHYVIKATIPPETISQALSMPTEQAALLLTRYTYSGTHVVTYVQMWHDGAQYQFAGEL